MMLFTEDHTGCISHCIVELVEFVSISVFSSSRMVRGAHFPPIIAWNASAILGSFLWGELHPYLLCNLFQTETEVHHHQVMIISYACAWKAPRLYNIYARPESLFQQYVIDLIVMLAIRRVPRPSPGCFVRTICIGQT